MKTLTDLFIINLPMVLLYLLIRIILIKKIKFNLKKDIFRTALVVYISSLIFLVWISGRFYSNNLYYNFIPFKTIIKYIVSESSIIVFENIIGNIIITIPFGFFVYFKTNKFSKIISYSILIPFTIELGQLLLYILKLQTRTIDIDDIILNSLGIILGYSLTRLFLRKVSAQ